MPKKLKLIGLIENFELSKYDNSDSFFIAEFDLIVCDYNGAVNVNRIYIFPSLEEMPELIIPNWLKNNETREINIELYCRWNKFYTYESEFWKATRNVI